MPIKNSFRQNVEAMWITMLLCIDYLLSDIKNNAPRKRYLLTCFLLIIGGGVPNKSYAIASPDDNIKAYVASNLLYDSNFLRVSENAPVLFTGGKAKSEFIKQVTAGFDMDWKNSRQHFIIKANANQNWFQNFTTLNYIGWNTKAQWNWQMGNHLSGEIGYANIQSLNSYDYLNVLAPNLQNSQRYIANAGYLFHPNGKINLGVFRNEAMYDNISRQISNNIEDNAELNLQYLSPTGSIYGLRLLATDGQYPQRQFVATVPIDNAYKRMNYAMTWDWHASKKSRANGFFGYTQQKYAHISANDFSGITARLNLEWQASDKTLLGLSVGREINQYISLTSNFLQTQGVWFNFTWKSSPKITLTLPISYQQQQFLGSVGVNAVSLGQEIDNVGSIGFNLMYLPVESISIDFALKSEKRDSNNPLRNYETQSVNVNMRAFF